ncbi:ABC transporter substrate-binding protein [Acetitomaculum ruminis]|nr:ABC transporter substrate-binding protein [Acetitomaculum ruminis]
MKKLLALGMSAAMAVSALAACGNNSSTDNKTASTGKDTSTTQSSNDSSGEKVLKFGVQMYSDGLIDPASQTNEAWNYMRFGIGESLFKFNDNMEVEPWLADSYEVSEDHKTWTIKLKDGIKFSDGCEMTASKVKASLDRLKEEGPKGSSTPEKYLEYEAEITADDDANTITIVTQKAYVDLTGNLANPVMAIVDVDDTKDFSNETIGTGPYKVESFKDQVGYTMVANENYREEVPYDKVEILFMGDASAKAMALKSGQIDLAENITNVSDIKDFQDNDDFTVDIASGVRTGFSWMNQNGVLKNETLRKAILMAIDYDTICESNAIGGLYTAGFSVLPSTLSYGYDKLKNPYAYDVDAAKKLLDDAKIVDTDGDGIRELDGENINLKYVSYENRLLNDFSDAHAQYLAEIGIGVTADYGSSDDQWSKLVAGEYDLNNNNWTTVGTGDPTEYLANWYSKSEADYCGYKNDEYDKLYEELLAEFDADKRAEIIQKLQQVLVDDAVAVIDGYYNSSMIYSKNVGYAHIHTADYYWLSTEITPAK